MAWLFALLAGVSFGVCATGAQAASGGRTVVIAHAAMNARVAPLWVARDRGFFAKYGVNADTIFVRGAPTLVAAMQSNEIDVGYTGGTAVVGAVANGADLKVLSAFTNRVTYDLMVKPGIKRPEDLRGKIWTLTLDPDRTVTLTRPDGEVVHKDTTVNRVPAGVARDRASGRSPPD
jgi:NitT/TauT family transport system substrate-binding protein